MTKIPSWLVLLGWLSTVLAPAADWPMWRCDASRSGATPEVLPAELKLQWTPFHLPDAARWLPAKLPDVQLQRDPNTE